MDELEEEIAQAVRALSHSPVPGHNGFSEEQVRTVARYRLMYSRTDGVWDRIRTGGPEAWVMAVHELAEAEALAARGFDPFNRSSIDRGFRAAHMEAVLAELDYLQQWAEHLGLNLSRAAIELANPLRNQHLNEYQIAGLLEQAFGWLEPPQEEVALAKAFWKLILEEQE